MIKRFGVFILKPLVALAIVAGLVVTYFVAIYPWFMNWGATAEEQQSTLPGDMLPGGPGAYFTRAITIDVPASTVWSWIIQIGQDRAGFYSNTWLENLGGNDIHNADVVRADWQQRTAGDWVPMARPEMRVLAGDAMYLKIDQLEPGVMINPLPDRFVLRAIDEHTTRLLVRGPLPTGILGRISSLQYDPLH